MVPSLQGKSKVNSVFRKLKGIKSIFAGREVDASFSSGILWNLFSIGILASAGIFLNITLATLGNATILGIFNQSFAFFVVISQLAVGGLQFSVLQQVSYKRDSLGDVAQAVLSALILVGLWGSTIGLAVFLLAEPIGALLSSPQVGIGITCIAPGIVLYGLNKVLLATLNGLRLMRAYAILQSLRYILILLLVVLALVLPVSVDYLPLSLTVAELLLFFVLNIYLRTKLERPRLSIEAFYSVSREHITFAIRGFTSGVLTELNTRVDILMLGYFGTDEMVGIYSFASTIAEGMKQIPAVIRWNVDPILGGHFARDTLGAIQDFASQVKRMSLLLMTPLCVVALAGYPVLLWLIGASSDLNSSYQLFIILLAGVYLNSRYTPFLGLMLQGKRPGTQSLLVTTLFTANVSFNLALIPLYGSTGAAVATAFVFFLEAVFIKLLARKIFHVRL